MPSEHDTRVRRVEKGLREELASLLAGAVKDPGAAGAIVTRVEVTKDLRSAKVFIRLLEGGDDAERRRAVLAALGRASGMLRREVGHALSLRHAPELRFTYDEGLDATNRVEQILAEIASEKKAK
ncbi:MAG TPA: 30S ribosome-binding factor RbfA [Polyangiaceae bacterium]